MSAEFNPYSVPDSALIESEANQPRERAGNWRRFGTWAVDYICLIFVIVILRVVVELLFGQAGLDVLGKIPDLLLAVIVMFVYYCFFESIWARTPGKLVLRTIVVSDHGGKPAFTQVAGRTLCRFIPFDGLSFFAGAGWHDSIPKTQVVLVRNGV